MFPLFLHSLLTLFLKDDVADKAILFFPFIVILIWLWSAHIAEKEHEDSPAILPESALFTLYPFFLSRFDFLSRGFELTGQPIYQFNLLHVICSRKHVSSDKSYSYSNFSAQISRHFRNIASRVFHDKKSRPQCWFQSPFRSGMSWST